MTLSNVTSYKMFIFVPHNSHKRATSFNKREAKTVYKRKNVTIAGSSSIFAIWMGRRSGSMLYNNFGHPEKLLIGPKIWQRSGNIKLLRWNPAAWGALPDSCPAIVSWLNRRYLLLRSCGKLRNDRWTL